MFSSVRIYNYLFEVLPFGPTALLLKPEDATKKVDCPAIAQQLYHQQIEGILEVIASEQDIVLRIKPKQHQMVLSLLEKSEWIKSKTEAQQTYKFPIYFDSGLDWHFVETHTKKTREEIINQLVATPFRMAMYGFIPGFLYLNGLPSDLHCPRKTSPRQRVPAGAVGIGGPYLGCYGLSSPGGWQIIGQCPLVFFDPSKVPPMPTSVNDLLEIEIITADSFAFLQKNLVTFKQYNARNY